MRLLVKYYFLILLFVFFIVGCEKANDNCDCISSIEEQSSMQKILININITNPDYGFVNTCKIDSIKIIIDGKHFGPFSSENNDTITKTDTIYNEVGFSELEIDYLVHIPNSIDTNKVQIIDDYLRYLEKSVDLSSGEHLCEISELQFKDLKNNQVILKPGTLKSFSVAEDSKSIFIGSFEIAYNK